jgi:hypothetical protein
MDCLLYARKICRHLLAAIANEELNYKLELRWIGELNPPLNNKLRTWHTKPQKLHRSNNCKSYWSLMDICLCEIASDCW